MTLPSLSVSSHVLYDLLNLLDDDLSLWISQALYIITGLTPHARFSDGGVVMHIIFRYLP